MKSMILVLKPEECRNLMNGILSVLVRKQFPKDYVGWVYIYCTKGKPFLYYSFCRDVNFETTIGECEENYFISKVKHKEISEKDYVVRNLNGKVVARFWCDKVENIYIRKHSYCCDEFYYCTNTLEEDEICKKSHLDNQQLQEYLGDSLGYAIHISKLEIFDKPKELGEFNRNIRFSNNALISSNVKKWLKLTKAPTNYCYVEG